MRALGLEPSLVRGKNPVPYQSGVTRIGGPGGNRTPCVGRRLAYNQVHPMARPTHAGPNGAGPKSMSLRLSRCWCPTRCRATRGVDRPKSMTSHRRLGRSRTPCQRCWRPWRRPGSSPGAWMRTAREGAHERRTHDAFAEEGRMSDGGEAGGAGYQRMTGKPSSAGIRSS